MKTNALIFIIGFLVAFGAGYLIWGLGGDDQTSQDTTAPADTDTEVVDEGTEDGDQAGEAVDSELVAPLSENNCLSCHAVDSIGAEGGTTGPDLSNAFNDTEGKHGKPLDEFLQEPTSAVMSTVIEGDPLSDEERTSIVEALQTAAEQ